MRDAQREADAKAALYTQRHYGEAERAKSARGLRGALRRLRKAVKRRG
jgi:hypothetical protein